MEDVCSGSRNVPASTLGRPRPAWQPQGAIHRGRVVGTPRLGGFAMARGRGIRVSEIVDRSIRGIRDAQREYEEWSSFARWAAPENLVTTSIARSIHGLDGIGFVTLEKNLTEAIEEAGGSWRGRRNIELPRQGRFDIVVWNQSADPRVVIEVKTCVAGYSNIARDVGRICSAVGRTNDLRRGLVVYYVSLGDGLRKPASTRVAQRAESIATAAQDDVSGRGRGIFRRHAGKLYEQGDRAWKPEILEIGR